MTKIRLPLLHESSEQSCNSAPFKKQSCKSAQGSTPVGTSFRGFRRGWREELSCKSACGTGFFPKMNCTATLTHMVSKLPCSYVLSDIRQSRTRMHPHAPRCTQRTQNSLIHLRDLNSRTIIVRLSRQHRADKYAGIPQRRNTGV